MRNNRMLKIIFMIQTLIWAGYLLYFNFSERDSKNVNKNTILHKKDEIVEVLEPSEDIDPKESKEKDRGDSGKFWDFTLKDYPNFPVKFYENVKKVPKSYNRTCAKFPTLDKINFNNLHWQTLHTPSGEFQIFGAYWDVRLKNKNSPTVRLLAMITPLNITEELYCQFWFEDKVILSQKTYHYFLWLDKWGGIRKGVYKPYLINCKLPKKYQKNPPIAVSLVKEPCEGATNIIKIIYNIQDEKQDFAVCVKGLEFHNDISIKFIEWIELLKLLGTEKIFLYELYVNEDIKRVLQYYEEEEGIIELTHITLPGSYPNKPYLQHLFLSQNLQNKRFYELISYNDCFLKHMYEYKYIVLLDIDEIIVPSAGNWKTLMENITSIAKNAGMASYNARNVYFFDDFIHEDEYFPEIPPYMHMLQHVYRIEKVMKGGLYIKSFHNTDLVLALHNHYPVYCVQPCRNMEINPEMAKLQHYRKGCVKDIKNCTSLRKVKVFDSTIWRFRTDLIENVKTVIDTLAIDVNI